MDKILAVLKDYGISNVAELNYNLSFDELFKHETNPHNEGYSQGIVTDQDAVAVDTGIFTGRSPKDKYIVEEETSKHNIWWRNELRTSSDNKPLSEENWEYLYDLSAGQLSGKKLYVQDGYAGANENTRIRIRVVTEIAWMAHFVKNMFIRPTDEELENFEPDFVMLNACRTINPRWKEMGMNSEVFTVFNLKEKRAVVGGTWYGGEIKKGFFFHYELLSSLKRYCSNALLG